MSYKLFSKIKLFNFEMQGKLMVHKFHCINNLKSLKSDALFSIDTKLKPILHNICNNMAHTVRKKLLKQNQDKVINKPLEKILQDISESTSTKELKAKIDNINTKDLPLVQTILGLSKTVENSSLANKVLSTDQTKLNQLFEEITYKRLVSLITSVPNEQAKKLVTHISSEHLNKISDLKINNLVLDKIVKSAQSDLSAKLNEETYSICDEFIVPQEDNYNPLLGVTIYNLYNDPATEL